MFDMSPPTCLWAEKGAWHFVWSDFGLKGAERMGWYYIGAGGFLTTQRDVVSTRRAQMGF